MAQKIKLKSYRGYYYAIIDGYYYIKKTDDPNEPFIRRCNSLSVVKDYIETQNSHFPAWVQGIAYTKVPAASPSRGSYRTYRQAKKQIRRTKRLTVAHSFNKAIKEMLRES